jgi:hypothetical protein
MLKLAEPGVSAVKVAGMNMLEPTPIEDSLARRYSDLRSAKRSIMRRSGRVAELPRCARQARAALSFLRTARDALAQAYRLIARA